MCDEVLNTYATEGQYFELRRAIVPGPRRGGMMIGTITRVSWNRIMDLAAQLESSQGSDGHIDDEIALRLARAVLLFQEQMIGGAPKTRIR